MERSIINKESMLLVHTGSERLEELVADSIDKKGIRIKRVKNPYELGKARPDRQVVALLIGSDVHDPIQSAQRFHAIHKKAKIVILSKPENVDLIKESINFSPFIGVDVTCLDESEKAPLKEELTIILENSNRAVKYRDIVAESDPRNFLKTTFQQSAFNQNFITKLMDVAPIGIAIVGQKETVLGWNKEAASIFKKDEIQVLGSPIFRLFNFAEKNALREYLSECFGQNSGAMESLTLERLSAETGRQILNLAAAPFTYSRGTEKALILAIKDVTKLKLTEQKLQEINTTLEERVKERTASLLSYQEQLRSLAAQLSKAEEKERHWLATELHDNLGQILALNKMKVSSLLQDNLPADLVDSIEDIKEGMEDALDYTRNLMSDLKPPPTLDKEDIRASIKWLISKMKKHHLQVTLEDDGHPKPVDDEIRLILVQCVRELLFNVIKHSGVEEARISLIRLEKEVKIIVEDKGKGFKYDSAMGFSQKGGFGLFNISERIDLMGGSLDIESVPGDGTKITLCAPVTEKAAKEQLPVDFVSAEDSDTPEIVKVLLVDDHKMMREGLKKIVNEQDDLVVIAEAANGREAIESVIENTPDVIVMDVNMPVMDGISATRELIKIKPNLRIIALTFHDHSNVVESMRNAGATAYLTKHEAFETLCATIRSEAKLRDGSA